MNDDTTHKPSRGGAADQPQSLPGLVRSWLQAALGGKPEADWRETIEELIEDDGEAAVEPPERMLLANILHLRDLVAHDVMIPRADIVAIEVDTPLEQAIAIFAEKQHSRVPIYRDTLDDIVGMLHIKDVLAAAVGGKQNGQPTTLADLVRELMIVAPSVPILDLLLQMREGRRHMALVVDEFGGIDGLITIEDLVEEIVGEIVDEHDDARQPKLFERPDGTLVADGRVPIEAFEAKVGPVLSEDEREDIDTLGGLVFSIAGRIPARGEVLRHPAGFEFEVVDADPRRIRRLRVRRPKPAEPPPR